jgi:D-alanyl-D-alanine carboxypeptidase
MEKEKRFLKVILFLILSFTIGFTIKSYLIPKRAELEKYSEEAYINQKRATFDTNDNLYYSKNGVILVNNDFPMSKDYNPGLSIEANNAFNKMRGEANRVYNITIVAFSTFRSYDEQEILRQQYEKIDGKDAENYSAKPGTSEHQTGLAFDIGGIDRNKDLQESFNNTEEAIWLAQNAYKYGFILRYPAGKEKITGKQYESWHYRYVGVEHAKRIYEQNLTLEEYLFEL